MSGSVYVGLYLCVYIYNLYIYVMYHHVCMCIYIYIYIYMTYAYETSECNVPQRGERSILIGHPTSTPGGGGADRQLITDSLLHAVIIYINRSIHT